MVARMPPKAQFKQRNKKLKELAKKIASKAASKAARKAARKARTEKKIHSFTNPKKSYIVTTNSCTCNDYYFRRKSRGETCKHMRELLK